LFFVSLLVNGILAGTVYALIALTFVIGNRGITPGEH
jgi:branched-subunit amino acid ABC-type transport system permease component